MKIRRFFNLVFLHLQKLPMKSQGVRARFCKWGGVNIEAPSTVFIGEGVFFDTNFPEKITIEPGARITLGCVILAHFRKGQNKSNYIVGEVRIKRNALVGARTIICHPITIGESSIVGAGSVVTKDIPDNQVWAGVPARFVREVNIND